MLRQLRLRFTLRAMLVVMTLFALFLWYHIDWIKQRRAALEAGWVVKYHGSTLPTPRAPGLLWLFGEQGYSYLIVDTTEEHPAAAVEAQPVFPEAVIADGMFSAR